jgi:hypothetical protein
MCQAVFVSTSWALLLTIVVFSLFLILWIGLPRIEALRHLLAGKQ